MNKYTKYIFVTGGVLSSLGKGLASAAIGALLESRGLTVTIQKLDPDAAAEKIGAYNELWDRAE